MKKTYKAAPGAQFSQKEAPIIGKALEKLERVTGGHVTAEQVVDNARPEGSDLHSYFTWDDAIAAEMHRRNQAQHLISHVLIVVDRGDRKEATRAWHSVIIADRDTEEEGRCYASFDTIQDDPDLRHQVVEQAKKEVRAWKKRYEQYRELFSIFEAIEKVG